MAKGRKNQTQELRFGDKLVLFKFMQRELGITDMKALSQMMNKPEEEGVNEATGSTLFVEHFSIVQAAGFLKRHCEYMTNTYNVGLAR